jgi:hypothetical protein
MEDPHDDLIGIWRSTYRYTSSSRPGEFESEHLVRLKRQGDSFVFESLPRESRSSLRLHLSLKGNVVSGSWQEKTDPLGYYAGATYHGVMQLIFDHKNKHMHGKWLGFGKSAEINVGPWELAYIGKTVPDPYAVR